MSRNGPITIVNIIFVVIVGFLLAGVVYLYQTNQQLSKSNRQLKQEVTNEPVALFFIISTPTNFYLKPVLSKLEGNKNRDKHIRALETLFQGPPKNSNLVGIFPPDTRVLGINLKNGLATVNLNRRATQLNVGSQGESLAVASIVNTLTKFPDVYQVKILIEGKEAESLAGHVDITENLRYNDQVVNLDQ